MENIIFYFSATGNSLAVAKDIADKLENTKLISIPDALKNGPVKLNAERVGFVFPSYYAFLPPIVKRFISDLDFGKNQYIFGVVTYGGAYGMTLAQLAEAIAQKGAVLNAAYSVKMPGNYIVKYGAIPQEKQQNLFKKEKIKAEKIAAAVKAKSSSRIPQGTFLRVFEKSCSKIISNFGAMASNFNVNEKCSGCGTCKKICPVENIKLKDGHPVWSNSCEHCVACIQWCPREAIEFGNKTANRKHYKNPEIRISEIMRKSELV